MSVVLEAREPSARYLEAVQPALVRQFELLATAPGGVVRLRELILTLAVQGKLVAQDPSDEPAAVLLQIVRGEKGKLIAQGRIRSDKPLSQLEGGEIPFELPVGWEWVRLGTIAGIERGGSPRPIQAFLTESSDGLNWIKIGDTEKGGKFITSTSEKIRPDGLSKTRKVYPGDFLLTNSMSFGRPYITQIEGCIHDGWLRISPPSSLNKDYLYLLLSSSFIRMLFEAAAAGGVVLNLNADKVRGVPIPLPPVKEQARIVSRVDELMRLCDALEAQGRLEAVQHARLLGTLLGTLTDSSTPEELAANWQRVADHFDLLLDRPEAVDSLEQTILRLAVRGMLAPQDANDETANDLLARVRAEKERLIRAGELKDQRPLAEIDDVPFDIPRGWAWARLGELGISFDYGSSQKSCDDTAAVPILRMGNVQAGRVVFSNLKFLKDQKEELPSLLLEEGDLLFNRTNSFELVGKTGLFEGFGRPVTFASYLIRIRPNESLCDPRYMNIFMNTQDCRKTEIEPDLTQQTGQANYNGTKLRNIRVPLPPREEQARIVARVDELRRLCADLRQRLVRTRTTQASIADASIEQALSA